jgi:hypothetical protein
VVLRAAPAISGLSTSTGQPASSNIPTKKDAAVVRDGEEGRGKSGLIPKSDAAAGYLVNLCLLWFPCLSSAVRITYMDDGCGEVFMYILLR